MQLAERPPADILTRENDADASARDTRVVCSIGVMAYNEAANIGRLLDALMAQQTTRCVVEDVIVLASGCTDDTEAIVREHSARYPQIKLIVQARREGKASAVNLFLSLARSDVLVLESADTVPGPETIDNLVAPFQDPDVGMTGAHPVPVNDPDTFMGFAAHLLWELHHRIALTSPKMGEAIAFRRIFQRIPQDSAVDEANIEPLIHGQGYQIRYVPDAVVLNRGPSTVRDFLLQRRRIHAGHLRISHDQGYRVATMGSSRVLRALLKSWRWDWRYFLWTPAVIGLETYGRYLGWLDFNFRRRDHAIWDVAQTTKGMIQ